MDWKKSLFAALKGAGYLIGGTVLISLLSVFGSAEWMAALDQIAAAVGGSVPFVGGLLAAVIKNALLLATSAAVAWLNNLRKHLGS